MTAKQKMELQEKFKQKGVTFCDEEVQAFCDKYEVYKDNKQKEEKKESEEEQEQENEEERTLAGDALERRKRNQ